MQQNPKVLVIELLVFIPALWALWSEIRGKRKSIPPEVVQRGFDSLRPDYRKKIDRSVGGIVRRIRLAVEVWARRVASKKTLFA